MVRNRAYVKELAAALVFMGFLMTGLGVFLFFVYRYIRHRVSQTVDCWTDTAERLGLDFVPEPGRKDPMIKGTMNGFEIIVGQTLHSKSSSRDVHRKLYQAGTMVEVTADSDLDFALVPTSEKACPIPEGWKEWEGGSADFQERFKVWLPDDGEGLSEDAQAALSETAIPVLVREGKVRWWQGSIEKDPARLEKMIRGCVAVAQAISRGLASSEVAD